MRFLKVGHTPGEKGSPYKGSLSISIPERGHIGDGRLEFQPSKVNQWIDRLPMGNQGETARQVFKAVIALNRHELTARDRLDILEMLRTPVDYVTGSLRRHYVGHAFPLQSKNARIAELGRALHAEMAIGYKIIVHDTAAGETKDIDARTLARAIHRTMQHLGRVMLSSYLVYAPCPASVWREINNLYHFAEQNELAEYTVHDDVQSRIVNSTIADNYKRLLLTAVASPYRLQQGEVELMYDALEGWAQHAKLNRLGEVGDTRGRFVLDLARDEQPIALEFADAEQPSTARMLDTRGLARELRHITSRLRDTDTRAYTQGGITVPRDLIKRLAPIWETKSKRGFPRTRRSSQIEVAMGLSCTHHVLDTLQHGESGPREPLNLTSEFDGEPRLPQAYEYVDHYNVAAMQAAAVVHETPDRGERPAARQSRPRPSYQIHQFDMLNISAGGYAIAAGEQCACTTQVGEVLALHESVTGHGNEWVVGAVRRMQSDESGVELGVQLFSPSAMPVTAAYVSPEAGEDKIFRCLLLPELSPVNQVATLLTPTIPFAQGNTVQIEHAGTRVKIRLTRMLEATRCFNRFQFTRLEGPAAKDTSAASGADKAFEDIWASI